MNSGDERLEAARGPESSIVEVQGDRGEVRPYCIRSLKVHCSYPSQGM